MTLTSISEKVKEQLQEFKKLLEGVPREGLDLQTSDAPAVNIYTLIMEQNSINRELMMQGLLQANWHKLLPQHNTIRTKFIEIDRKFYDYLLQDGTFIHPKYTRDYDEASDIGDIEEPAIQLQNTPSVPTTVEQLDDIDIKQIPEFPAIATHLQSALNDFGGCALLKIAWRSPKDCKSWLPEMKCTHIEDVFMALKCSEYMSELLVDYEPFWWPQDKEPQRHRLYLVLKQFKPINRAMEFRCFIRQNRLVGVCQRNPETVYPEILERQAHIKQLICRFISEQLSKTVITLKQIYNYVVDIFLDASETPVVLDIQPWRQFTNPLMLDWQDLEKAKELIWRVVRTQQDIICEDLRDYNIPSEFAEGDKSELLQMMQLIKTNPDLFY